MRYGIYTYKRIASMNRVLLDCEWDTSESLLKRYKRFTPGNSGRWGPVVGVDKIDEADFVVCIGPPTGRDYAGRRVIQLRREPDFVESFRRHPQAESVLDYSGVGYHACTYHLQSSYDDLMRLDYPVKKKTCSLISSSKWRNRNELILKISNSSASSSVDFFGKSLDKVIGHELHKGQLDFPNSNCKEKALLDYRYSIAIENSRQECYFSEKLIDCFLTWTMPIYWGCPNISKYFPEESLITFSEDTVNDIQEIISTPVSRIQIEAMSHSRQLVLNKYGLWPTIDRMINEL